MVNGTVGAYEGEQYYFHPDHLGSSSFITDTAGEVYEHLEYFPYGETWGHQQSGSTSTPYKFTGKELDVETGLYYYGARYYDPRTSVWVSADPILAEYMDGKPNGGVFNPKNLMMFSYTANNPVNFVDPDGNAWMGTQSSDTPTWIPNRGLGTYRAMGYDIKRTFAKVTENGVTIYGPGGKNDIQHLNKNTYKMVQFPTSGRGISRYGKRDSYTLNGVKGKHGDNWAKPAYAAALYNAVQGYLDDNPAYADDTALSYNDISAFNPRINLGHKSHKTGEDADYLYMDFSGRPVGNINQRDPDRQNAFSKALSDQGITRQFTDQGVVSHTKHADGHVNHSHAGNP